MERDNSIPPAPVRPSAYDGDADTDLQIAGRIARQLAPQFSPDSEIAFALSVLAYAECAADRETTGIDDATLSQFVIHQPDAVALQMGLIAAEAARDAADDGSGIDQTSASYLIAARDAVYDLTKKLVAARLELEKVTADVDELNALRRESALLTALEAEALRDPIYLHDGSDDAIANRKHARGLGFGPSFGRTLRDALAPFLDAKGNR